LSSLFFVSSMAKITYADSVQPDFGIPFPDKIFRYDAGELKLKTPITEAEAEQIPREELEWRLNLLENHDKLEEENPLEYGWTLPSWRTVLENWTKYKIIIIFGGNRGGKSTFCARLMTWLALNIPEARVRCFHVDEARCIEDQHAFIWESLPQYYKHLAKKKGTNHSIRYNQLSGFSGDKVILPPLDGSKRGSEITFSNYNQFLQNPLKFEGLKAHAVWLSEEAPKDLFKRLIARTADFHGRIILDFTTVQQWTDLVEELLGDPITLKERHADWINETLPIEQLSGNYENAKIFYWWTEDNPFIDHTDLFTSKKNAPIEEKKAVLYGVPTRTCNPIFTGFSEKRHVRKHEEIPFIKQPNLLTTRYLTVDPAPQKRWVMLSGAAFEDKLYIYREYPDFETYGKWALPHQKKSTTGTKIPIGKPGPATRAGGMGTKDYARIIKELEGEEKIYGRVIDPRAAKASSSSENSGVITVLAQLSEEELYFSCGSGVTIDIGLQRIVDLLAEDRIIISDRCVNLSDCMFKYTNKCGNEEAYKDFIDALRYLVLANPVFLTQTDMNGYSARGGY
jgi:phage terminase large subunit-like protein